MTGLFDRYRPGCLFISVLLSSLGIAVSTDCPDLWIPFWDSCYLFGTHTRLTFVEAEHYCRQQGSHLVRVDSAAENIFIKDYLRNNTHERSWMGLTDKAVEGRWVWNDTQATPTFIDWAQGEPNDKRHNEDCGLFSSTTDYQWNDAPCTSPHEPVCEIRETLAVVG